MQTLLLCKWWMHAVIQICIHVSFIMFNNESAECSMIPLPFSGLLLVALITLLYEVSALTIIFSFPHLSLHPFYWPCVFKADVTVQREVSCYISFSRKNKRVWAHAPVGAAASR